MRHTFFRVSGRRGFRRAAQRAATVVALSAALPLISGLATDVQSKAPGASWCYKRVCHRVRSLEETRAAIGQTLRLSASYYDDPRFDRMNTGKYTSNGEAFDANSPGRVSSADFPDGTELLLRNPANGRVSHVRVNDFGPFYRDRTLDVTRRVAKDLGFLTEGVTALDVTVVAAPEPGEPLYRRNRVGGPALGHLGVVDEVLMPSIAADLIDREEPVASVGPPASELKAPGRLPPSLVVAAATGRPVPIYRLVESEADGAVVAETAAGLAEISPVAADAGGPEVAPQAGTLELAAWSPPVLSETSLADLPRVVAETVVPPRMAVLEAAARPRQAASGFALARGPQMGGSRMALFWKMAIIVSLLVGSAVVLNGWVNGAVSRARVGQRPGWRERDRAWSERFAASPLRSVGPGMASVTGFAAGPQPAASSQRLPSEQDRAEVAADALWPQGAQSIIETGIEVVGTVRCHGHLVVAGTVTGRVVADSLEITETGLIEGEVEAQRVWLLGRIEGRAVAHAMRLEAGAQIKGEVFVDLLSIEEGAELDGDCHLKRRPAEPEAFEAVRAAA